MSSRTKKSVSLKPRSPVSLLAYRIIQFFPEISIVYYYSSGIRDSFASFQKR